MRLMVDIPKAELDDLRTQLQAKEAELEQCAKACFDAGKEIGALQTLIKNIPKLLKVIDFISNKALTGPLKDVVESVRIDWLAFTKEGYVHNPEIEKLKSDLQAMASCRDHWKVSYETVKAENARLREALKNQIKMYWDHDWYNDVQAEKNEQALQPAPAADPYAGHEEVD